MKTKLELNNCPEKPPNLEIKWEISIEPMDQRKNYKRTINFLM